MPDVTAAAGKVFGAYDQMCRDLSSLATDFGTMIAQQLEPFETASEYSYSPNKLFAKPGHAWYWETRAIDVEDKLVEIRFAAVLALFEPTRGMKKIAASGRPELWFFAGWVKGGNLKPNSMNAQVVASFLGDFAGKYSPPLHLGAPASNYAYGDDNERWHASCLGLELGEVDRPEAIAEKVLRPLLAGL